MTNSNYLASRLREVYLNGTWIAYTNYKDQLEKTSWKEAIKQVESLNSIAALTYHINYYLDGVLNAFRGSDLEIRDKYSFDLPPINNEAEWLLLVRTFLKNAEDFIEYVANFDEDQWKKAFAEEKYGNYLRNIEGVIEHSYYHLGQIVLIKKLIKRY